MSSSKATAPTIHGGYPNINYSGGFSNQTGAVPAPPVSTANGITANGIGISANDFYKLAGVNTVSIAPAHAIMQWGNMADGNMDVTFTEEESGVWVKAVLSPAYDLSPKEGLAINLLITGISILSTTGSASRANLRPISYIRKHNLERHFNISLV
jgi:hypothetical protein